MGRSLKGSTGRMQGTVIPSEIAKFDGLAAEWWDPRGPMGPLHAMNPARTGWILQRMEGQRVLDIGCGAGLASEALARAGKDVVGLDRAAAALAAARAHAAAGGWPLIIGRAAWSRWLICRFLTPWWRWRWWSMWPMCRNFWPMRCQCCGRGAVVSLHLEPHAEEPAGGEIRRGICGEAAAGGHA